MERPESQLRSRSERVAGSGISKSNINPRDNKYKWEYLNTRGLSVIINIKKLRVQWEHSGAEYKLGVHMEQDKRNISKIAYQVTSQNSLKQNRETQDKSKGSHIKEVKGTYVTCEVSTIKLWTRDSGDSTTSLGQEK